MMNDLLCEASTKEQEHICVARLVTTAWRDDRGVHVKKSLKFLKRKCVGFNILDEDCTMIGAEEVIPRITNFNEMPDGVYRVVICNESRDWETGDVYDYDYKLVVA